MIPHGCLTWLSSHQQSFHGNGKATNEAVANATKNTPSKTMFAPASRKAAEAAKKGTTSTSRTGKAKQVSYEFGKPPKGIYVKVHPSPAYHTFNLPVFVNENEGTFHYINPELFESGESARAFSQCLQVHGHSHRWLCGRHILLVARLRFLQQVAQGCDQSCPRGTT